MKRNADEGDEREEKKPKSETGFNRRGDDSSYVHVNTSDHGYLQGEHSFYFASASSKTSFSAPTTAYSHLKAHDAPCRYSNTLLTDPKNINLSKFQIHRSLPNAYRMISYNINGFDSKMSAGVERTRLNRILTGAFDIIALQEVKKDLCTVEARSKIEERMGSMYRCFAHTPGSKNGVALFLKKELCGNVDDVKILARDFIFDTSQDEDDGSQDQDDDDEKNTLSSEIHLMAQKLPQKGRSMTVFVGGKVNILIVIVHRDYKAKHDTGIKDDSNQPYYDVLSKHLLFLREYYPILARRLVVCGDLNAWPDEPTKGVDVKLGMASDHKLRDCTFGTTVYSEQHPTHFPHRGNDKNFPGISSPFFSFSLSLLFSNSKLFPQYFALIHFPIP